MATNIKYSQVAVPTGFEQQQVALDRRRKIQEALMAQSLNPQQNMTSWAQAFAPIVQALAAKRMGKSIDADAQQVRTGQAQQMQEAISGFYADANSGMSPQDLVQKYRTNPYVTEALKPYEEAFGSRLKSDQELVNNNGVWQRKAGLEGTIQPSKPTDNIIVDQSGVAQVNPLAIDYSRAAQGYNVGEGANSDFPASGPIQFYPDAIRRRGQQAQQPAIDPKLQPILDQARAEGQGYQAPAGVAAFDGNKKYRKGPDGQWYEVTE